MALTKRLNYMTSEEHVIWTAHLFPPVYSACANHNGCRSCPGLTFQAV